MRSQMERLKNIAVSAVAPLPPPARNNRAGGNFSICLYQFYCSDTEMPFYKNGGGAGIPRHKPTREFFFGLRDAIPGDFRVWTSVRSRGGMT
jgi:hypothetical protein